MAGFPEPRSDRLYLTEGGQETEIMYKHGHDLPEFAMFPLLDSPAAVADLKAMWTSYLDTVAHHGCVALMGGLDYRASPDWAAKLGYSAAALHDFTLRAIDFLRDVATPYQGQTAGILITGIVGPRGDAYQLNRSITEAEAEDYHSVQITTLKTAGVDLISAMTLNSVAEAVGIARAAAKAGLPLGLYLTLDSNHRLKSGPTVAEAIAAIDAATGPDRPDFYGINCSHPMEFEPVLKPGDWITRIRALRPNAALMEKQALCQIGHLVDGDPCELGHQMADVATRFPHIDIWGGCCGTWDRHLHEIAGAVGQSRASQRPATKKGQTQSAAR